MRKYAHILLVLLIGALVVACANIGSPQGGARDYTPPRVIKTSPDAGALNFKGNKVEITFDEIVNIKDQMKKVSVSPVQKDQPIIKSLGKKVVVEFRDKLMPNTTYTIDFANAIEDNNEENQLDGYAFSFSTGEEIDTMRISGIVLRARDLEPMQHVLVGAYHECLDDSAFTRLPMERVTRTNSKGEFTLMGLKPSKYRVFALIDMDGDYHWVRTEDYAFYDHVLEPTTQSYTSQDTIFTFDHRVDSVMTATHTAYLPDDVLLCMTNEQYQSLYLKTAQRISPSVIHVLMSTASPELPRLEILSPSNHEQDWCVLQGTARNDSLFYWMTDSTLIKADTIKVALSYIRTDSADALSWKTDTLSMFYRKSSTLLKEEQQARKESEQLAKRIAQLEQKLAQGKTLNEEEQEELEAARRPKPVPLLELNATKKGNIEVYDTLAFTTPTPIKYIDPQGVHLEMKRDTLWIGVDDIPAITTMGDGLTHRFPMRLMPDSTYRLTIDTLAVTSIYGLHNAPLIIEVKVKGLEEYANLRLLVNVQQGAFVELLSTSDQVLRTAVVKQGIVDFNNVLPGTYYARLVLDRNGNGKWDQGNYLQHIQPEEVYYYPKPLKLRSNWDVEQVWNIYETPLNLQKPDAIKKNKPEQSKNKLDRQRKSSSDDEEEEDDEFNSRGFGNNAYSGNKYNDYQNNNRNNRRRNR